MILTWYSWLPHVSFPFLHDFRWISHVFCSVFHRSSLKRLKSDELGIREEAVVVGIRRLENGVTWIEVSKGPIMVSKKYIYIVYIYILYRWIITPELRPSSKGHLGMISGINHDSRVRSRREVVIIYPDIWLWMSPSLHHEWHTAISCSLYGGFLKNYFRFIYFCR